VLHCDAVCCDLYLVWYIDIDTNLFSSVLQYVAMCCRNVQFNAACRSLLQRVAAWCIALQFRRLHHPAWLSKSLMFQNRNIQNTLLFTATRCNTPQHVVTKRNRLFLVHNRALVTFWRFHFGGWRRCIGSFKLQASFCKSATIYRVLLQKITNTDKASYGSSPLWRRYPIREDVRA